MNPDSRSPFIIGVIVVLLIAVGVGLYLSRSGTGDVTPVIPGPQSGPGTVSGDEDGLVEIALGQTGTVGAVRITPREVVEDSRCATDVQCIQAGTIRVRATLESGLGTANQVFLLGEPITTEAEAITLVEVKPAPVSTVTINDSDYRFVFKVENRAITYTNATSDIIRVTTPTPGAVVGKTFTVSGQARGNWYFEASFPIDVLDANGRKLVTAVSQAQGEWMTTNFVPFSVSVTVPASYIGPATLVLHKDNPSGLSENDASISFPITIEY